MMANIWGMIKQTQVQMLLSAICMGCSLLTVAATLPQAKSCRKCKQPKRHCGQHLAAGDAVKPGQPRLCALHSMCACICCAVRRNLPYQAAPWHEACSLSGFACCLQAEDSRNRSCRL